MSVTRMRGFSLIELMVALAIAALLLVLAAPSYGTWVMDGQIRAAAESIAGGLRIAYSEAIKRNVPVQFVLDPTTGTGKWDVVLVSDSSVLRTESFAEGSKLASFTADGTTVEFTSLGLINPANTDLTSVNVSTTTANANARQLTVLVGGGRTGIKVCDPKVTNSSDPRYCTT